jgi:thiol-disulfide isomerase/thioredoxin
MSKKSIFKNLFVLFFVSFAFSCGSDNDSAPEQEVIATSITVSANTSNIITGESVTFTVINNLSTNVTSNSIFTIDGENISNPNTFSTAGSFQVTATNGTFTDTTTITVNVPPLPTSILLTVSTNDFWFDQGTANFIVTDNLGNNLSGLATYAAEPGALNNPANFSTPGTYNATATYLLPDGSPLTSNTVVLNAVASTHTTKVMIEDYTGTWCGYCPRLATAVENTVNANANVIPVAIHSGDPMEFAYTSQLESSFGISGYPTGKINRTLTWNESTSQPIGLLDTRQNMGLAINSSISGGSISAEVKVHFDLKVEEETKIVVYLLENGLAYDQENYYNSNSASPWFGYGNPIIGFIHDHTARDVFTNVLGDLIPSSNTGTGTTYTVNYNLTVPSSIQSTANLELVAFVVGQDKKVLNVQKAALGENKDFD